MNKKDKHWWAKQYYCTTLCEKEDFHRARIYLNKKSIEDGYGLIVSSPIQVHKFPDEIQYKYNIPDSISSDIINSWAYVWVGFIPWANEYIWSFWYWFLWREFQESL